MSCCNSSTSILLPSSNETMELYEATAAAADDDIVVGTAAVAEVDDIADSLLLSTFASAELASTEKIKN